MKLKPKTIQIPKRIADKYQWNGTEKFLQDGLVDGGEESAYEIGGKQALLLLGQDNEIFSPKKVETYMDTHGQFSIYKLVNDHGYIM